MTRMREAPDNHWDLAICDPPYGLDRMSRVGNDKHNRITLLKSGMWNVAPSPEYFTELFRVSSRQIIWGANNFTLPDSEYFIVWDKQQSVPNFASAEYAWTNVKIPAKVFRYPIHQVMQERVADGGAIHPTQKPVALYRWLLTNYAKPGDTILDTHLGSQSSRIAAWDLGFDFTGFELDEDYYKAGCERFERHIAQPKLFAPTPVVEVQESMFKES